FHVSEFRFSAQQFAFKKNLILAENFFFNSHITVCRYKRFGTKLALFFGFAKISQIQDHLQIKPIAQIACNDG
ncbi:hypothetical protein, partial [Flavobacterium denitrificans]|uniref:hypothetical protein n=1 Tax=Flavobacterium denitrificans TaxID=281361 RepID=UPI001ADFE93E